MTTFTRGDRVRILTNRYPTNAPVGSVGTIDRILTEDFGRQAVEVVVDNSRIPGFGWFYVSDDLEYIYSSRKDWTALTDRAEGFIGALNLGGYPLVAELVRDLKNALIEESYR